MTLSLISEPLKSTGDITDSNVLAVRTQARYEFLREDFVETTDLVNVADSGGFVQITTVAAASTLVSVNDNIYFTADDVYDDVGNVTAVNANDFVTNIPFVSALTPIVDGYVNNLTKFPIYRVEFEFNDQAGGLLLANVFYTPKQNGVLIVNLAETFFFLLFVAGNQIASRTIAPEFREVFTGSSTSFVALTDILAVRSKRQLLTGTGFGAEGANLILFLLFNLKADQAALITKIKKVWRNWSAESYFIWDDGAGARVGATIRILVNNLDINQTLLSNKSNVQITPSQPAVRVFTVSTTSALAAKTEFLEVFFRDNAQTQDLALRTIYTVQDECENPIMISWVNSLGATEQFLFSFNQEIDDVANVGTVTVPPIIDDIANEDIGIARTNVTTTQFITLFADHLNNEEHL